MFGMLIALAYERGVALPAPVQLSLMATGFALFWLSEQHMTPSGVRAFAWGVPAALLVAGAVLGKRQCDERPVAGFAKLIGDSSYSIYLMHTLVGGLIIL